MMHFIQKHALAIAFIFPCLIGVLGLWGLREEGNERCRSINNVILIVDELVDVATDDGDPQLAIQRVQELDVFKALDPEDQAFWLVILQGITTGEGGTTAERLQKFADERLITLDC